MKIYSPQSTRAQKGRGVKIKRTADKSVKDDRKYYPAESPN